ncbi:hypothetical protein PUMCH_004419 [Australozyma saopauloensis]|uniref:Rho-GAP domain-containing protein n=1 Tax=Australozyma saopauloensis TaxID=291208 RepID=A0AAX4HEZ2_9ASCO|nr:hypothetical protein PUMCH_004419 [[Candida] saopauloensis]
MTQSANRNSIIGWVKNLKRNALLNDSVNEIDPNEDSNTLGLRSPPLPSFMTTYSSQPIAFPTLSPRDNSSWLPQGGTPDLLRPHLSHKSRSANNINRERSTSNPSGSPFPENSHNEIRQHRDSFLQSNLLIDKNSQYFGVPLSEAVEQAAAKISILGSASSSSDSDSVLHYGRIPIVVAKCGVYLKNSGLNVEGIFRVAGSSKRIKDLQIIFNTPPSFGKKLNWDGFTVHDAASVLRRYLNALPEPLIVLDLYEDFRDVLCTKPRIMKYLKFKAENPKESRHDIPGSKAGTPIETSQSEKTQNLTSPHIISEPTEGLSEPKPSSSTRQQVQSPKVQTDGEKLKSYRKLTRDMYAAIGEYKILLDQLPDLSKQLLFYILDLLAMVQNYSLENLMSARNLAAIFQPSILLHPDHDMDPNEYALSQSVVEFLIQYAYKILPSSDPSSTSMKPTVLPSSSTMQADNLETSSIAAKRHHSKSFSTNAKDFDMIGYKSASQGLEIPDHSFAEGTSDEDLPLSRHIPEPTTDESHQDP